MTVGAGPAEHAGPDARAGRAARAGGDARAGGWRAWTAGSTAADVALLAAVLVAGSVSRHAVYTGYGLAILVICALALAAAVHRGAAAGAGPSRLGVLVALAGAGTAQVLKPPYLNVAGRTWELRAGVLACLAATVLAAALLPAAAARWRGTLAGVALAAAGTAYLLVIRGSARPLIDVWVIVQGAALGVVHGHNPYTMTFPGVPAGQVDDCFNYLPGTFLLPVPSRLLTGEVRYANAAVMLAGVAALAWYAVRRARAAGGPGAAGSPGGTPTSSATAPALALLVGVLPGTLYDVQQAWNETVLLGTLAAAAVLLAVHRPWWAAACLAVALGTKQHVVLLLPLWALWPGFGPRRAVAAAAGAAVVVLPWFAADPGRFWHCAVQFFLDLPPRADSLSLWQRVPGGLGPAVLLLLAAAAYLLAVRRLPRTPGGLLLGCGLVLTAFDLANKQSFLNQWLLAAQLVVAGLALTAAQPAGSATTSTSKPSMSAR